MPRNPLLTALRRVPWSGAPLTLLLLLALAALLAHWTWRFAAPVPSRAPGAASVEVRLDATLEALHAARLFGGAAAATAAERPTSLSLKLRGVFAALGGLPAVAILAVDGQDQAVTAGSEVQPGVTLDAVAPDHVILLNRGVRERLDLEALGRPLSLANGDVPVTRDEIRLALANPQTLGAQAQRHGGPLGGLVLTQVAGDGLVARLGLQAGDVLRSVNGYPVNTVQDLAQQLGGNASVQRVTLAGERAGRPLNLSFSLQQGR